MVITTKTVSYQFSYSLSPGKPDLALLWISDMVIAIGISRDATASTGTKQPPSLAYFKAACAKQAAKKPVGVCFEFISQIGGFCT